MAGIAAGPVERIVLGARVIVLLAMTLPNAWYGDVDGLIGVALVAAVWSNFVLLDRFARVKRVGELLDAALTGVACGVVLDSSEAVLAALVIPPFVAGVRRGLLGSAVAASAGFVAVVAAAGATDHKLTSETALALLTWLLAGVGLGLVGTYLHSSLELAVDDDLEPYLDAQRLIKQLLDLSTDLSSGLDVTSFAGEVVSAARDQLPTTAIGLYRPRGEVLVPLVTVSNAENDLDQAEELAVESWARFEPLVYHGRFAFPLGDSVVVAGVLAPTVDLPEHEVERSILALGRGLEAQATQLETALLFSDFRDAASADVRTRLAREMHDGVAQDIASLGYLIDAIAARPADEKQATALRVLRERVSAVVAEVRQSVLTLRTSIGESQSLGAAISTVARHLSESSQIAITVTVEEHSTRLRPEVEAELFRITQEAMNNAVKHAQCTTIEVSCQVHAPRALITVTDDGRGLQIGRSDSHGLKIMRERARLVGAELRVEDAEASGVRVSVEVAGSGRVPTTTLPDATQR